ncbi:MAG: uracil-DNA glycosylase [bacterium]|nr:uracil-DNA glycosylase [bacterium]
MERKVELDSIRTQVLSCTLCGLSKTRDNAVPGEGNYSAEIIFIGEGPGANEDEKGIPFCGASGKFLDEMLASIKLDRDKVFITNTVKCRPPGNRDPEEDEKVACRPYLERQIELIAPKVIVCLGRHAAASLLPGQPGISAIHGKALKRPNGIVYLPLYHPAAALHNGSLRATLINDFAKIPTILKKISETVKTTKIINETKQERLI